MSSSHALLLKKIKVVEFTHMVMGPAAGLVLADLGAEVTKVEPLGGDKTRNLKGSGAGYFPMYNRNKQSLCIDLKSEEGQEVARRLISQADVLIENFRPGAMDKLGFGYADMSELNPRLIYCSLKGFLTGPYENRTALDEVTQMMGGLAYMTGLPDKPMRAGSSVIDITGGMFGVIGILAALQERHSTGKGRHITGSLFETTAFMVGQHIAQETVLGEAPPPMSVRRSAWSIYDIFHCQDDERVFVGVVSDGLWQRFCKEFEFTDFANNRALDTNAQRVTQRDTIMPVIKATFAALDKDTLMARLERAGIPFAPINTPSDLVNDPHLNSGGLLEVTTPQGKSKLPSLPIEIDGERTVLHHDLPLPGEDAAVVLRNAGYPVEHIERLLAEGII